MTEKLRRYAMSLCLCNGFTLIEIIITIIVISIGVLGLISAISFTTGKGINAETVSTAQLLAQERMEQLIAQRRASGYASIAVGTSTVTLTGAYADYSRTVETCYVDTDMNPAPPACETVTDNGYKRITITVLNTRMPAESGVSLVSLVADYD